MNSKSHPYSLPEYGDFVYTPNTPINPNHPADHGFLIQPHWAHGSFVSLWPRHGVVNGHGPDVETCHGYDLMGDFC